MKRIIFLLALFALVTVSCVKMPKQGPEQPNPELGLKIPNNFDWKTTKEIKITVTVTAINAQSNNNLHVIKIYSSPLLNSGSLMATGAAYPGKPYNIALTLASPVEKIYLYEEKPNGLVTVTEQTVASPNLNIALTNEANMLTKSNAFVASNVAPPAVPAMPFPVNYDQIIDNNDNNIDLLGFGSSESSIHGNTYKSYYIPQGFNRTKKIDFGNRKSHTVLYVKGSLTISGNTTMEKASIVILDGGTVSFSKFSNSVALPIPFIYIEDGGTLTINNSLTLNNGAILVSKGNLTIAKDISTNGVGTIINEGAITLTGNNNELSLTNNFTLYNSGTINVSTLDLSVGASVTNDSGVITTEKIYFTNNSVINNHGEIVSTVQFKNSGGGTVNNFCRITAQETDAQALTANLKEGSLWNTQSFKVDNSTLNMDGGSMFLTANVSSVHGMRFISTSTSFALVKNTGNMPDLRWTASEIKGNIEFVHEKLVDGTEQNGRGLYESSFSNGAILSKEQTKNIPGTSCNLSLGQIIPDTPPVEPEFESFFPSQTGWGTYAFEDLWPSKGDYDLNDMVLKFRVTLKSNAANNVTKIIFDYNILAVGADKTAAVAFQLDNVPAANIGSVTGQVLGSGTPFSAAANGTETGVNLAVIPLFNSAKDIVSYDRFLNTDPSKEHIIAPMGQVTVTLSTPVPQAQLTMAGFNLFISVDERGKEIHLPTYPPTSKFNSLLAVGATLNLSDVFKHQDGMMWGLMFPDTFAYPKERKSIINAYTHFAAWATSGGMQYQDWYSDSDGYRDQELIY